MTPGAPTGVGLGLRWAFLDEVAGGHAPDSIPFFEVSPENYMRRGGSIPTSLDAVAERYPILTHGLMMNVGGTTPLDPDYLAQLRAFCERMGSTGHSDHLCWSGADGAILHDLLPLPHDGQAIARCVDQIHRIQDALGLPFAVENISYYLVPGGPLTEAELVTEIVERADCGLLLDVNNVAVNANNHGFDPIEFLAALPLSRVVQLHVAGGERRPNLDNLIIDTHGTDVSAEVTGLMQWVIERIGPRPVIYERDHDIPPLAVLGQQVAELRRAYDDALATRERTSPAAARRTAPEPLPEVRSLEGVQRGLSRVICAPDGDTALRSDPGGWLRTQGVVPPDDRVMAEVGAPRLLVYRSMVRSALVGVTRNFIPRTVARLGEAAFAEATAGWLDAAPPTSRYLRDVPGQFVRWAAEHPDALPGYLLDLARLEILEDEIDAAPDPPPVAGLHPQLVLDRPLVWNGACSVVTFEHAVHVLPTALDDRTVPEAVATRVLVYRDPEHEVRTLALSPLAFEVLRRLVHERATVSEAIAAGAPACGEAVDDTVLGRLATLLADLAQRGVLRGSEGPPQNA